MEHLPQDPIEQSEGMGGPLRGEPVGSNPIDRVGSERMLVEVANDRLVDVSPFRFARSRHTSDSLSIELHRDS